MKNKIKSMSGYQLAELIADNKLDYHYFIEDNKGNRFTIASKGFECVYCYEDEVEDKVVLDDKYFVFTLDEDRFPTYYRYQDFYKDEATYLTESDK